MGYHLRWISADGVDTPLDGSAGIGIGRGALGLDSPPKTLSLDPRVSGDGAVKIHERRPERNVLLPLLIDEEVVSVRSIVRMFQAGTLVSEADDGDRRLRSCEYDVGLEGEVSIEAGGVGTMTRRRFKLALKALDPWWYGGVVTVSLPIGTRTGWNPHLGWSPHLPWNGGTSQMVTITGDTDAFPVVTATGPFTELTVGLGGGLSFKSNRTLVAGQTLVIDSRPGSIGPTLNGGVIDWTLLTEDSPTWKLPIGNQSMIVGVVGSGTGTSVSLSWEPRFLTA